MNARDGNSLHVLVIAASSARRHSLAALAREVRARTIVSTTASAEQMFSEEVEVALVDVDGPGVAAAILRTADALPAGVGLTALADNPDSEWVRAALRAGVNAILSRDATGDELRLAMMAAEAGLILLQPTSIPDLGNLFSEHDSASLVEALTAREQEVLELASEGLGNKEIALRLNISDHTVKFHISSILGKLGAGSRTEAVSQGIRRGLISI